MAEDIYRIPDDVTRQLPQAEIVALIARWQTDGDVAARNKVVEANMRFVVDVAAKHQGRGLDINDLIGEGSLGLMEAANRFDFGVGVNFISYAVHGVRQAILKAIADQGKTVRYPQSRLGDLRTVSRTDPELSQKIGRHPSNAEVGDEIGMTAGQVTFARMAGRPDSSLDAQMTDGGELTWLSTLAADAPDPMEAIDTERQVALVRRLMGTVDARKQRILTHYYGIGCEAITLDRIGQMLGLTRERIRQLKEQAIETMQTAAKAA